jgi:muramoyltetrapeptide carboxypeptidase LdcA involved in peptidoglycan recycling
MLISIRILPHIDIKIAKKNPKIILGYSDTTSINPYFNQFSLVTLNGPSTLFSHIH